MKKIKCPHCGADYKNLNVVCDESNNTPEDVKNKVMRVDIDMRPYPFFIFCPNCGTPSPRDLRKIDEAIIDVIMCCKKEQ